MRTNSSLRYLFNLILIFNRNLVFILFPVDMSAKQEFRFGKIVLFSATLLCWLIPNSLQVFYMFLMKTIYFVTKIHSIYLLTKTVKKFVYRVTLCIVNMIFLNFCPSVCACTSSDLLDGFKLYIFLIVKLLGLSNILLFVALICLEDWHTWCRTIANLQNYILLVFTSSR